MIVGDVLDAIERLPMRDLDDILAPGPLLVLAPHPDDESIGCGGLIALATAHGREVHVIILTDGTGSHPESPSTPPARLRAIREAEAQAAVASLGLEPGRLGFLGQPDARAPHDGMAFDTVAAELSDFARRNGIATILTTWRHDPHCDHEAAAKLADTVARETDVRHVAFPVWGWTLPKDRAWTGPMPGGARLDISMVLPAKRRAIAAHVSQTTTLISDSPFGFQLPTEFLALFDRPWEAFITP